jgi:hypothetical protein
VREEERKRRNEGGREEGRQGGKERETDRDI